MNSFPSVSMRMQVEKTTFSCNYESSLKGDELFDSFATFFFWPLALPTSANECGEGVHVLQTQQINSWIVEGDLPPLIFWGLHGTALTAVWGSGGVAAPARGCAGPWPWPWPCSQHTWGCSLWGCSRGSASLPEGAELFIYDLAATWVREDWNFIDAVCCAYPPYYLLVFDVVNKQRSIPSSVCLRRKCHVRLAPLSHWKWHTTKQGDVLPKSSLKYSTSAVKHVTFTQKKKIKGALNSKSGSAGLGQMDLTLFCIIN